MRQGRAKGNFPLRGPVSLICYLKSGKLFQIRIAYDFLAAGDEIAQSLALEKTIGKKSQVSKLLENLILGSELLDFRLVGIILTKYEVDKLLFLYSPINAMLERRCQPISPREVFLYMATPTFIFLLRVFFHS